MKRVGIHLVLVALVSFLVLGVTLGGNAARAQSNGKPLFTVRPGTVNMAEGAVSYSRGGDQSWMLRGGELLMSGDSITTAAGSRAEILLRPGAFLRMEENSSLTFFASVDRGLAIDMSKGSAIVEVVMPPGLFGPVLKVSRKDAALTIMQAGVYRFSAGPSERLEANVYKGSVKAGNKILKDKVTISAAASGFESTALKQASQDTFGQWSQTRSKELATANKRIDKKVVVGMLGHTAFSTVWVLDSTLDCYTFLPGYNLSSPYGWNYPVYSGRYGNYSNDPQFRGDWWNGGLYSGPSVFTERH